MVLIQPTPFIILAIIIYSVWMLKKPQRKITYAGRIIFLAGCVLLAGYYLLPLPLDHQALEASMDSLLPLNEAIRLNPLAQIIEDKRYLDYYFANQYPIFGAAALIGFSADLSFAAPLPFKKHMLLAFLIPTGFFAFHAVFRLITGYMWKRADSGQIFWFVLFYFLGYGVCLLAEKIRTGVSARYDAEDDETDIT